MRTQRSWGEWFAAVLLVLLFLWLLPGCARFGAAGVPSDQKTPLVLNADTMKVLLNATDKDSQILASALEATPESGSVIYVDQQGYVYGPDGRIVPDPKTGEALRMRTKIVAKLNSLQSFKELAGVAEVDYEIGGRSYLTDLPDNLKHLDQCPVPLRLRIKGLQTASIDSKVAANREAAGKEREAIFAGMSALATSRGAAYAVRVKAIADGVQVVTAAGAEIVGKVLTARAVPSTSLAAGITKAVESVIRQTDGTLTPLVAEGDNAGILETAAK